MATGVLIPIAISSHFDKSGDERVHAAGYNPYLITTKPEYTKYLTSLPYDQIFYDNIEHSVYPTGGFVVTLLFDSAMQSAASNVWLTPTGGDMVLLSPPLFYDAINQNLLPTNGQLSVPPLGTMSADKVNLTLVPSGGFLAPPPLGTMKADDTNLSLVPTGGTLA